VLKSTHAGESSANLSAVVVDEISVVGSRCGDLSLALAWMAEGRVDPRPLIESTAPLSPESVLGSKGRLKTLLRP
jgi:threonine dehydrogenase-like Zn-dependent dehydrogenase